MSITEYYLDELERREEQHDAIIADYATNVEDDSYSILDED